MLQTSSSLARFGTHPIRTSRARFSQLGSTFNQGVNHQQKTSSKVSENNSASSTKSKFKHAFNNLSKHIRFRPDLNDAKSSTGLRI